MPHQQFSFWLLFNLLYAYLGRLPLLVATQSSLQPCPENPIVLVANNFDQFVYSPYDELNRYPPNTDCRFILVARTLQRRIHIKVIDSKLEEPLFADCKDYVSVRDGALETSPEILRWCDSFYPPSLTSSGDSLYIYFHSDNIIQSRGFNLSFVDFGAQDLPGCPPGWIPDSDTKYCYQLFGADSGYTFVDAQKVCFYERANLLTLDDANEYDFITNHYSGGHSLPWIGYNDANREGVVESVDPNVKIWPENFPSFGGDHIDRDCVYLDWDTKAEVAYKIDNCFNRHSLICKKKQDGTTVPIQLSSALVRYGFQKNSFNILLPLILLLILLIFFIILWILYQKCTRHNTVEAVNHSQSPPILIQKERTELKSQDLKKRSDKVHNRSTVAASKTEVSLRNEDKRITNVNFQQTASEEAAPRRAVSKQEHSFLDEASSEHRPDANRRKSDFAYNFDSPRIHTKPNQPIPTKNDGRIEPDMSQDDSADIKHETGQRETTLVEERIQSDAAMADQHRLRIEEGSHPIKVAVKPLHAQENGSTKLNAVLPPIDEPTISRELNNATGLSSTRSRATHPSLQTFERPHVGTLENISAISLDEFWQRN